MQVTVDNRPYQVYGFLAIRKTVYLFLSEDGQVFVELRPEGGQALYHHPGREESRPISFPEDLTTQLWQEPGCGTCRHMRRDAQGLPGCHTRPSASFLLLMIDVFRPPMLYQALSEFQPQPLVWPVSANLCPAYELSDED